MTASLPVAVRQWAQQKLLGGRVALREVFAHTDGPEVEQGFIRLTAGILVLAGFIWHSIDEATLSDIEIQVLSATLLYVFLSVLIIVRIVWVGGVSRLRRVVGMAIDNAGITFFMAMMGETGAVMFGLYLFVIFGNGFRYGRRYLHLCQAMALSGFGSVMLLDSHWASSRSVGLACFAAIVVLPFYVGVLSQRITEAKRRADEANLAKGRFLANVSHEMRTPLNGVIAMADVLRETNLNDGQREIVETMTTSANLLLAQIEDVLDMAKIEAGRIQIERRAFDFGKLLSSTVKVVLPQARYKGLTLTTDITAEAATWVIGDPHHIRQVVLNLLSNAVKFTERGQVVLRARSLQGNDGDAKFRVEVQDTGIGIPAEKQALIFEAFAQADDSITRVYGGTGLGTTIAKHLVTQMGGTIGLQSAEGKGSVFWFDLPLPLTEPQGIDFTDELLIKEKTTPRGASSARVGTVHKIRGARILVAEDNQTNQRVAQLILESADHIVTIVHNGEEALDALETGGYDLALFDLSMPQVSGLEALKLYRFSTSQPIPILILSANVTTEAVSECMRAGAAEFIPKPLRASILLDAIERHLMESRPAQALAGIAPPEERRPLAVIENPLLDGDVLRDLERLSPDPTFVERLIEGFKGDIERLVGELTSAIANRRYDLVRDAGHALKGGSGSVGAMQLMQLASRLEKAPAETLRSRATQTITELHSVSAKTVAALVQYLDTRRKSRQQGA